ncbi:MAG: group 1 glycosyl transferase [Parcubacteria group bacterium Gr01-1014_38]|nr:MAG: group 1 glycosyl transferase [Parcubacteria group bacterium Gr01-1014_38]
MRITHVTLRYPPASGGVEEYVYNLVERLRALNDDVTVETTALRTHHPATLLASPLADPPYVHRHAVRTFRRFAYPLPRSLRSSLLTAHTKIIHAHGFWYAPADIAARIAQRRQIPFVLNPYYVPRAKPLWTLYRTVVGKRTLSAADAVVVISPQEEAALRADGLRPRHVELIPPGIDPDAFVPRHKNPFEKRGLAGKPIVFSAGRLARAKGLDLALRALPNIVREIPTVHLAIAGEDFGEQGSLKTLAETLGVSSAITWLGKLPREELLAAYQHATVFISPSRYEAFGIAVLEAQAAGCPVVVANASSLPFLVSDGETGLLSRPEDPEHLAAAMLRLLKDRPFAERLAQNGRMRALRDFTWTQSLEKLRSLYTDLTHARST